MIPPPPLGANPEMTVEQFIYSELAGGGLAPGAQLPTERDLALRLGYSRHEIRCQLDSLAARGHITRETGRGTFLRATGSAEAGGSHVSPRDLIEARLAWEPNVMSLVTVTATADDFEDIRMALDCGNDTVRPEEFRNCDFAFHRALFRATHNAVVCAINAMVEDGRRELIWGELDRRTHTHEYREIYRVEHREIAEAVFARDSVRAVSAMRSHLISVRQHLLQELG